MSFHTPPWWALAIWVPWLVGLVACFFNVRRFYNRIHVQRDRATRSNGSMPQAVVIVPAKGTHDGLADHIGALLHQDYSPYRLVVVVESEDDPAFGAVRAAFEATPRGEGCIGADLLVAGQAQNGGQKVHNQLCALATLTDADQMIVFADADAVPGGDWLAAMCTSAMRKDYGAATGYRWMVPADSHPASRLGALLNASVATILGRSRYNQAWGGSMAIPREVYDRVDLSSQLRGALSDDYQLTRAILADGSKINFNSLAMPLDDVSFTWSSLLEFARRQHRITRVYRPKIWFGGLVALAVPLAGWTAAAVLAAQGNAWGLVAMGAALTIDAARGRLRWLVVKRLFGPEVSRRWRPVGRLDMFATPLWLAAHLLIALSTAVGRRIRWAGITYHMAGPQEVRIVARDDVAPAR